MLVRVKRFFISSTFGNVDEGRILDLSDAKAKQLIGAGLACEHVSPVSVSRPASSFQSPVEANQPGSLSPAGQALQKETVKSSEAGEPKVTYRKKKGSRS